MSPEKIESAIFIAENCVERIEIAKGRFLNMSLEHIFHLGCTSLQNGLQVIYFAFLRRIAKEKKQIFTDDFNVSVNGKRLAEKLNKLFGLQLQPKIKRFIKNDVKFLMIDEFGKVYEFKGIVLDFIANDVAIELCNKTFNIK